MFTCYLSAHRYHNCLNSAINFDPFSYAEDRQILRKYNEIGGKKFFWLHFKIVANIHVYFVAAFLFINNPTQAGGRTMGFMPSITMQIKVNN